MSTETRAPEQRTIDVDVESLDTRGRTVVGYAAVYGALSEDLGGFREKIAPGAFAGVMDADVRCLLNHSPNEVLGRTKSGTLRLADEQRGLRFELDLPDSPLGENVRSAVSRGDLDGASFRFVVGEEDWQDDVRTVTAVKELHDITLATYPAYPAASIELRTRPDKETIMEPEVANLEQEPAEDNEGAEERTSQSSGGLRSIQINEGPRFESRSLADMYRQNGWARDSRAELTWSDYASSSEMRALTWSGTVDAVSPLYRESSPYGSDQRYAWPAFGQVGVDSGVTSIQVLTQTARTTTAGTATVRAIDAVTNKPEAASTMTVSAVSLKQVAAVQTGVPNIYLEQDQIESVIGQDLRLSVNEGLDYLVLSAFLASGFSGTADPMLVNIRKAMTTIFASGYSPDTVILTPAASEALDVLTTGLSGGTNDYVFGPARFAPGQLFGLNVRVSKTIPAPVVVDAQAFGKMYISPISLDRFEENAGRTNTSLIRMEGNAAFGVERQAAAVRIAAS